MSYGVFIYLHDDVIKWKKFSALLAICAGNSPVNSPHKGQWRGALMFSLICARINGWVNNGKADDLRRHWTHYGVIVMMNILEKINTIITEPLCIIVCFSNITVTSLKHHGISNTWQPDRLFNCLLRLMKKKSVTRGFPTQRGSNRENISMP